MTSSDLARARWAHRIGRSGNEVEAELPNARVIRSRETKGVLNRLAHVPIESLASRNPEDREYAVQEWHAFVLGWLQAFPGPVLNPAGPRGLCGPWRYPGEWRLLADRAGLRSARYQVGEPPRPAEHAAIVIGADAFVPEPLAGLGPACIRLSALAATPLLEVYITRGRNGPEVVGASPLPELRATGETGLEALQRLLTSPS